MTYQFKKNMRVYLVPGVDDDKFCPNPELLGEIATIEEPSKIPGFYHLEEFPGLWPAANLVPVEGGED